MFDEDVCSFTRFIIAFFHDFLVQLVVEFDCCFNQVIEIFEFFASTNQLVFDIVFEFSAKHNHENSIVSFDKIDLLLKSDDIIDCRNSLRQMLNVSFDCLFLVEDVEDSSNFFLEVVVIREYVVDILIVVEILFKFKFKSTLRSASKKDKSE